MTHEELDEATVEEAKRRWLSTPALRIHGTLGEDVPFIAAASPPPPPYSAKGDCPDWLALVLGALAVCALYAFVVYAWWSL